MLSIGWTEMMLVAAVALIVVGPRDLPAMLRQIGKVIGSVRRMGNEFKSEFNKITAADEIRDIKKSISAPLNETRNSIEKEFNSITEDGKVVPSGKIVPSDPKSESVVEEIRAAAGMGSSLEDNGAAAKASITAAVTKAANAQKARAQQSSASAAKAKTAPGKTASSKKGRTRPKSAAKSGAAKPSAAKSRAAKPSTSNPVAAKANGSTAAKAKTPRRPAGKGSPRASVKSSAQAGKGN